MDIAIYLRKSRSEEQTDTMEQTLARHKETLLNFANSKQYSIIEIYEEVVSGESLYARPQMLQLLEDVEDGLYDAVMCMDIDRLGRGGMHDQGIILDTFKYSGTLIITPDKTYDLNNDTDEVLTEFKTFMSRQELKIITKRLKRGLHQTISEGGYIANAPYGYTKIRKDKKPTLEINEDEAYFVRMMFDMYLDGIGCDSIATTVNSLGAKPHRSNSFSRSSVRFIISNPAYIGKIVWDKKTNIKKGSRGNDKHITIYNKYDKWTIIDGIHPAIVLEEIYSKAQEILHNRYIPSQRKNGELKNPLAGLVKCSRCGGSIQRQLVKGILYIRCFNKGCIPAAKFELVEVAVINQLEATLSEVELQLPARQNADISILSKALQQTQKDMATVRDQTNRLRDFLEQGIYDVDTYRDRSTILKEKLDALTEQGQSLKKEIAQAQHSDTENLKQQLKNLLEIYWASNASAKNRLLKSVIQTIDYDRPTRREPFTLTITLKKF